jgi:Tfp pilus assembly protein PilV
VIERLFSERGSTFIEVLAATAVFAVVVIGLSPTLLNTRKVAELSKNQSVATTLAEDKVEQIRTLSAIASGSDGPLNANGTSGGIFNRSWTVTANSPTTGVSRVEVVVTWRDRPSTSSVRLVTLVPQ